MTSMPGHRKFSCVPAVVSAAAARTGAVQRHDPLLYIVCFITSQCRLSTKPNKPDDTVRRKSCRENYALSFDPDIDAN